MREDERGNVSENETLGKFLQNMEELMSSSLAIKALKEWEEFNASSGVSSEVKDLRLKRFKEALEEHPDIKLYRALQGL